MEYDLTQWYWQCQNSVCTTIKTSNTLYINFYSRDLEIELLANFLMIFLDDDLMLRETNLCKVLLFFVGLFQYI